MSFSVPKPSKILSIVINVIIEINKIIVVCHAAHSARNLTTGLLGNIQLTDHFVWMTAMLKILKQLQLEMSGLQFPDKQKYDPVES